MYDRGQKKLLTIIEFSFMRVSYKQSVSYLLLYIEIIDMTAVVFMAGRIAHLVKRGTKGQ
jgi:hypothetical protein